MENVVAIWHWVDALTSISSYSSTSEYSLMKGQVYATNYDLVAHPFLSVYLCNYKCERLFLILRGTHHVYNGEVDG